MPTSSSFSLSFPWLLFSLAPLGVCMAATRANAAASRVAVNRRGPRPNLDLHYLELHYLSFLWPNLLWPSKPKSWPKLFEGVTEYSCALLQQVLNEVICMRPPNPLKVDLSRRTIIGATIGRACNARRRRRHNHRSIPSLQIVLRAWSYCARADLLSFQALRVSCAHTAAHTLRPHTLSCHDDCGSIPDLFSFQVSRVSLCSHCRPRIAATLSCFMPTSDSVG